LRELKDGNLSAGQSPLSPVRLAELLSLIKDGTFKHKDPKEIFAELYKSGTSPKKAW